MQTITKTYAADDLELKEGSHEFIAVISTGNPDRDNEVVMPGGMKKKNYNTNPIILLNHSHETLPIGKCLWCKQDGNRIVAKGRISQSTAIGKDVWSLMSEGVLKSFSIGFQPIDRSAPTTKELQINPQWASVKSVTRSWELLEFSVVGIPANSEAQAMAIAKGLSPDTIKFLGSEWEAKPETKSYWDWTEDDDVITKADKPASHAMNMAAAGALLDKLQAANEPDDDDGKSIPLPTYSRSWKHTQARLDRIAKGMTTGNDLMNKLRGRV